MTNLDFLLDGKLDSMKAWSHHMCTTRFVDYLKLERESAIRHLKEATGLQELGKYQGDLERIDKTIELITNVINDRKMFGHPNK